MSCQLERVSLSPTGKKPVLVTGVRAAIMAPVLLVAIVVVVVVVATYINELMLA